MLENLDNGVKDSIVTTKDGTYGFPLEPDVSYRINAEIEGFLPNGFTINTRNIYRGELLNDILLEEVYVDKLVAYFDFDEDKLKTEYETEMKQLIRTLKRFPESILNIAAHADSRGQLAYNKRLSEDRLKTLVSYFKRQGIQSDRIHGTALGEELLLNQCSDGTDCHEDDHSKNRRGELKVQLTALH